MDAVVIGSIVTVVVSVVILGYLSVKLKKLMDSTHSDDNQ